MNPKRKASLKATEMIAKSIDVLERDDNEFATQSKCIESIEEIRDLFEWETSAMKHLPALEARLSNVNLLEENRDARSFLICRLNEATYRLAKILFPANPEALVAAATNNKSNEREIKLEIKAKHLVELVNKLKKNSIERRAIAELIEGGIFGDTKITFSKKTEARGYSDYNTLMSERILTKV